MCSYEVLAEADGLGFREPELDELRGQVGRALFYSLHQQFVDEGMDGVEAARVALRSARQAVLRALGFEQREILECLTLGKRMAAYDAARVRTVLSDGSATAAATRPLPPVPVPEGDLIRPSRTDQVRAPV